MEIEDYAARNFNLPIGMRPILQLSQTAVLLIVGPAPGMRAHNTGVPWNDASGDRLRTWLALSKSQFYNKDKIALISLNFWYPGTDKYGRDEPPNLKDADKWHKPLVALLPKIKLILLVGYAAQAYYLQAGVKSSLSDTVLSWKEYLPGYFPLPHPSWHNNVWIKNHPWFERELIPDLREQIQRVL